LDVNNHSASIRIEFPQFGLKVIKSPSVKVASIKPILCGNKMGSRPYLFPQMPMNPARKKNSSMTKKQQLDKTIDAYILLQNAQRILHALGYRKAAREAENAMEILKKWDQHPWSTVTGVLLFSEQSSALALRLKEEHGN
jgi:hypothetical protein